MPRLLITYLAFVNLLALFVYGLDKGLSKTKSRRIPERVLLWLARLGGGVGCWLGMTVFRHKTKHSVNHLETMPFLGMEDVEFTHILQ